MVYIQRRLDLARYIREDAFIRSINEDRLQVLLVKEERGSDEELVDMEEAPLDPRVKDVLFKLGFRGLYGHQVEAARHVMAGDNVIIVSSTGSGKTEAFLAPLVSRSLMNGERHVIVYPTKALARDQERRMNALLSPIEVMPVVYDGDSDKDERDAVYSGRARIILTNPDMINAAMPRVRAFRETLANTRYVVFDEFHVYNGVLGTHLHYLVKRMRRINNGLSFIAATATIGNPLEYFSKVIGAPASLVAGPQRRGGGGGGVRGKTKG